MPTDEMTQVRLYELIHNGSGRAKYNDRFRVDVPTGTHQELIRTLAGGADHSDLLGESEGAQEDLDIIETKREGLCVYVFRLNAVVDERHRLRFVDPAQGPPLFPLPTNSSTNENFWLENKLYEDTDGLWASFACDIGAIRGSELAQRIHSDIGGQPSLLHSHELTIPFCFNVVDPLLEASPWMAHPRMDANGIIGNPWIHGGVHPKAVVFLRIPLA